MLWASAILSVTLVVLVVAVMFGLITPRVGTTSWSWGTAPGGPALVDVQMRLDNDAWADAQLLGGGESLPGMRLVATTTAPGDVAVLPDAAEMATHLAQDDPIVPAGAVGIGPGESATLTVVWQVTDCASVPADPPPIPLRLRTPLGLDRTLDGPAELGADDVPWTLEVVRAVCGGTGGGGS